MGLKRPLMPKPKLFYPTEDRACQQGIMQQGKVCRGREVQVNARDVSRKPFAVHQMVYEQMEMVGTGKGVYTVSHHLFGNPCFKAHAAMLPTVRRCSG